MAKMKNSTFDMKLVGDTAKVSRKVEFEGGDIITFDIALGDFHGLTVTEIHQRSARRAIELLEEWLAPPAPGA